MFEPPTPSRASRRRWPNCLISWSAKLTLMQALFLGPHPGMRLVRSIDDRPTDPLIRRHASSRMRTHGHSHAHTLRNSERAVSRPSSETPTTLPQVQVARIIDTSRPISRSPRAAPLNLARALFGAMAGPWTLAVFQPTHDIQSALLITGVHEV